MIIYHYHQGISRGVSKPQIDMMHKSLSLVLTCSDSLSLLFPSSFVVFWFPFCLSLFTAWCVIISFFSVPTKDDTREIRFTGLTCGHALLVTSITEGTDLGMTLVLAASSIMLRLFSGEAMLLFTFLITLLSCFKRSKIARLASLVLATTNSATAGRDLKIVNASACVLPTSAWPLASKSSSPVLTRPDLEAEELGRISFT